MAQVKGKFITLACALLEKRASIREAAAAEVLKATGTSSEQLNPEGWYETAVLGAVLRAIEAGSPPSAARAAIRLIGENIYPTIKATAGLPGHLTTPLDFVKFEADGFLANHRGPDVIPRKIVTAEKGNVIVQAPSPGYSCVLIEGVFAGILAMCGVSSRSVKQLRCVARGDDTCEYHIRWASD